MIRFRFIFFWLLFLISFFLPVITASPDQVLYGYECFVWSYIISISAITGEGKGSGLYALGALLLGCFANSYLIFLCFTFYVKKTLGKISLNPLMLPLSCLSVLYWLSFPSKGIANWSSFPDKGTAIGIGYYFWSISTVILIFIYMRHHRNRLRSEQQRPLEVDGFQK